MLTVNLLINRQTDIVWKYCVLVKYHSYFVSDKYEYLEYIVSFAYLCIKVRSRVLKDFFGIAKKLRNLFLKIYLGNLS